MRFSESKNKKIASDDLYGTGGHGDSASLNIHFFDDKKSFLFVFYYIFTSFRMIQQSIMN